jgi:hypothetical protein
VLAILQFIWGGLTLLGGCGCGFYVGIGSFMLAGVSGADAGTEAMGGMFVVVGSLGILLVVASAALSFMSASFISSRKNRTFCLVASCVHCIGFPLGTALGIFGLLTLLKPAVKDLFEGRWQPPTPVTGTTPPRAPSA